MKQKETKILKVSIDKGLWGDDDGGFTMIHTIGYIYKTKAEFEKTCTARATVSVESDHEVIVTIEGTSRQVKILAEAIEDCVVTIDKVEIVNPEDDEE